MACDTHLYIFEEKRRGSRMRAQARLLVAAMGFEMTEEEDS
jgi:hypothetical protein